MRTLTRLFPFFVIMLIPSLSNAVELFDGKLKADFFMSQAFQSGLEVDADGPNTAVINPRDLDAESGFNRTKFALQINAQISENWSGFIELAEEFNDFGEVAEIENDLGWIQYKYNDVAVRVGEVVPTTMNFIRYTDGAVV